MGQHVNSLYGLDLLYCCVNLLALAVGSFFAKCSKIQTQVKATRYLDALDLGIRPRTVSCEYL